MILYLIKSGLCLAILLGIYLLFLEREKMHQFNRFFLLFALAFGLTVPLITFEYTTPILIEDFQNQTNQLMEFNTSTLESYSFTPTQEEGLLSLNLILWISYLLACSIFAYRFIKNLGRITRISRENFSVKHRQFHLVLVEEQTIPHSFFKSIFLNKNLYEKGKIDPSIIEHEAVHAKQYHSLDILFVEVLRIIFWFNPIFYFFKKAIQINHEFIADQCALKSIDSNRYKKLMLSYALKDQNSLLTSSFNFSITKKRLTMITKPQKKLRSLFRKLLLIPILAVLVFAFSEKVVAQDIQKASISELIDQLNTKLDYSKSLSAVETKKLTELINKLQKKDGLALPPPPKVISAKEATLFLRKPVKVSVVEREALKKARKAYTNAVSVYLGLDPQKNSLQELESSYQKVKKAFDVLSSEIKNTDYGSKPSPPPPPLPPSPEQRKKHNG